MIAMVSDKEEDIEKSKEVVDRRKGGHVLRRMLDIPTSVPGKRKT